MWSWKWKQNEKSNIKLKLYQKDQQNNPRFCPLFYFVPHFTTLLSFHHLIIHSISLSRLIPFLFNIFVTNALWDSSLFCPIFVFFQFLLNFFSIHYFTRYLWYLEILQHRNSDVIYLYCFSQTWHLLNKMVIIGKNKLLFAISLYLKILFSNCHPNLILKLL